MWGLIFRSLYPPEKLLNTACTAQAKAGSRFAGMYFPLSPHCCLNRGSPLKCLWPLEERGRGLIRLFCQIGHTTSTGTVTAHLLTAATVSKAESCGAHAASAMGSQLQNWGIYILTFFFGLILFIRNNICLVLFLMKVGCSRHMKKIILIRPFFFHEREVYRCWWLMVNQNCCIIKTFLNLKNNKHSFFKDLWIRCTNDLQYQESF